MLLTGYMNKTCFFYRPIKGIQGFTREVVVALIANIETQEHRRQDGVRRALPPEHPRASSTDDVEGFFSILHGMLGQSFDLKTFFDQYPKIVNEFYKRIDPSTPFYYWASRNERFHQGPLRSFNEPSGPLERLDRIVVSHRADPGVFEAKLASLTWTTLSQSRMASCPRMFASTHTKYFMNTKSFCIV